MPTVTTTTIPREMPGTARLIVVGFGIAIALAAILGMARTAAAQTVDSQALPEQALAGPNAVSDAALMTNRVDPAISMPGDGRLVTEEERLLALEWQAAMIYELNRLRAHPQLFASEHRLGSLLDGIAYRPPLAPNPDLFESALTRTTELTDYNYFAHQSVITNQWPNWYVRAEGYDLPDRWADEENNVESLAGGYLGVAYALRDLIEDKDFDPPAHRYHLLATGPYAESWAQHNEIGVAYSFDPTADYRDYLAIHTAYRVNRGPFATGVVYADANANGRFDRGEGLPGVTILIRRADAPEGEEPVIAVTGPAGLWAAELPSGRYEFVASGGDFVGEVAVTEPIHGENISIDFTSGRETADVNFSNAYQAEIPTAPELDRPTAIGGATSETAAESTNAAPTGSPTYATGCSLGGDNPLSAGTALLMLMMLLLGARFRRQ